MERNEGHHFNNGLGIHTLCKKYRQRYLNLGRYIRISIKSGIIKKEHSIEAESSDVYRYFY
jgi:hypothetical protein